MSMDKVLKYVHEAHDLGVGADSNLWQLLDIATASPADRTLLTIISQLLQPYRARRILDPDPLRPFPGPESGLQKGEIEVGTVRETDLPWRI